MDHIHSCYRSQMRLFPDRPDVLVTGDWHFCKPGAKLIPFVHSFASMNWDDYRVKGDVPRLGEVAKVKGWTDGSRPKRFDGDGFCGDADVWKNGVVFGTPPLPVWSDGLPRCCNPHPPPVEIEMVGEVGIDGLVELLEMVGEVGIDGLVELPADSITLTGEVGIDGLVELPADSITLTGEVGIEGLMVMAQPFSGVFAPSSIAGLPDSTLTAVTFGTPDYDTDGYWSGGDPVRLSAPVEGWYHVTAFASFEADATGARALSVWVNGSTLAAQVAVEATGSGVSAMTVSCDVFLEAGEWVEVDVYQASGSALDVSVKGWMHLTGV